MTTPRTDKELIRIAVVGMVVLATLFAIAINFQRLPLVGAGTEYRAEFTDASGLVSGEEVRVAGIKVGNVTGIKLGHGKPARVVVTFTVKGVDLGSRTTASIEVKTLLGQHYLGVTPLGSGTLHGGAMIPLARTTTPVNIVPAFQRLTTTSEDIDTAEVAKAFDVLATTLDKTAPEMTQTLRGLSRLSKSVTVRDAQIRELFARTSQVSGVVADRDQDIATLVTSTSTVLAELDRRRETITSIIDGTVALAKQLSGLVQDNKDQLAPALAKLNGVLAVLRSNRTNLDQAIRVAAVYGREFVNVGGSGHFFDTTIKAPHGAAVCTNGDVPAGLMSVLGPILSQLNSQVNNSSKPCLPLGPAPESAP
ncbi:MCE family protein [Nocardioides marmorisolisilvae]|uniref:MCE family protein n=1 Tax=Nocardioides marmorisolisilvae TaxID=1542737 RepID=A0A3N0E018_9ACTN|nr:MCE family protein [Nocardioides marmorisolisilvae]RNL81106.1 MCE family protein [Nocardioides marmorisolisilvae]